MTENEISGIIVDEAIHIHRAIGPGLLESVYLRCLVHRLEKRGLMVESQVPVPLIYDGINLECGYRADSVVENKVLIETKCIEAIAPIHVAQVLTYLKFLNLKLGLILNFNEVLMKNGIKRIVHNL